jgi:hypothetical protein
MVAKGRVPASAEEGAPAIAPESTRRKTLPKSLPLLVSVGARLWFWTCLTDNQRADGTIVEVQNIGYLTTFIFDVI